MRRFVSIREFGFALVMLALGILGRAQEARSEKQHTSPPLTKSQVEEPAGITAAHAEADRPSVERPPSVPAIGAGDLLKVSVLGAPESDQEVRVGADGNIFLILVGSVHVAGLTTEQAQATIAKKMVAGGFFTDPQVSVFAKEYATQGG